MNEKVSIIVPVYKVETYLSRCLDSILNQTYTNIEIILIDDGSPDNSGKICDEYALKDKRIRVIHQENKGVSAARNAGLRLAEGEYIGFVDSDDYIEPDMYERMVNSYHKGRDLVMCGSYACNEDGVKSEKRPKKLYAYEKRCPNEALKSVLYEHVTMAVWSKLFRRNYIVSESGVLNVQFSEELSNYEDFVFICEYVNRCEGNLYFLPDRLYNYCYQSESLSRKKMSIYEMLESLNVIVGLQDKYEEVAFQYTELFFVDTVWKYWVMRVWEKKEYSKLSDFEEHEDIQKEIAKYKKAYYGSSQVQFYKKIIVYLLLEHDNVLFFIAKKARRFI